MASSCNGEPTTAPQPNRWYDLRLGSSCRDLSPTAAKFCTLRYEFKPASIDKSQAGSLQSTKDNRVTVEFHNNQPGKPKVTFEGSQEEYKDNDGVLFFDGESFRLERLHRAVKRLRHVRVPGESAASNLAATTAGTGGESHSPPFSKNGKSQSMSKPAVPSVPVEVERIDIGEPENPVDWWRGYAGRAFELQRFARRLVSLCASSSGCERNWSTFEFMHTKKRNRLLHKRLNALVYISYNRKMQSRFQKRKEKNGPSYDPLVIEDFDWDNEWIDSSVVHPGRDNDDLIDLTWDHVDEAVGASSSLRGRNLPRQASKMNTYQRRARMRAQEVEEGEEDANDSSNEELEEDPHDDMDVSDSDEGSGGGDEEENDPTFDDEFDDGY